MRRLVSIKVFVFSVQKQIFVFRQKVFPLTVQH